MISLSVKLYFNVILLLNVHDILARLQDDYWSETFDHSKNCKNEGRRQKCVTMSILFHGHGIIIYLEIYTIS